MHETTSLDDPFAKELASLIARADTAVDGYEIDELPGKAGDLYKQIPTLQLTQVRKIVPEIEREMGLSATIKSVTVDSLLDANGAFDYDMGEANATFGKENGTPLILLETDKSDPVKEAMCDCFAQLIALIEGEDRKARFYEGGTRIKMNSFGGNMTCRFHIISRESALVRFNLSNLQHSPNESTPVPKDPEVKQLIDEWREQLERKFNLIISSTIRPEAHE
jgi:hypothetical protein